MLDDAKARVAELRGGPIRFAVHQPAYHPNIYYFRKMAACDVFVSLDTVQFTPRNWQNRQVFFHAGQRRWLTMPVNRGREPIARKRLVDHSRLPAHWQVIQSAYGDTPFYDAYRDEVAEIYRRPWTFLVDLCDELSAFARRVLAIDTPVVRVGEYFHDDLRKGDLLAELIVRLADPDEHQRVTYLACAHPIRPDHYILGRHDGSALSEKEKLEKRGVEVGTFPYRHPTYPQANVPAAVGFQRELSIVDLIFNLGPRARAVLDESGGADD